MQTSLDRLEDVVKEYNNTVHSTTKMTPNDAAEDKNNAAVRRHITKGKRLRKKIRQGIRPPLNTSDLVKIMVPHSFARRINIAQYGPDPFLVQEVVTDGAGLKRYRVIPAA